MKRLVYDAPGHHLLEVSPDLTVEGGEEFELEDEHADQLLADRSLNLRVVSTTQEPKQGETEQSEEV